MLAVLVLLFKTQGDNQKKSENKDENAVANSDNSGEKQEENEAVPTEAFPIDNIPVVDNTPAADPVKVTNPAPVAPAPVAKPAKKTKTS